MNDEEHKSSAVAWQMWLETNRWYILLALVGLILLGLGVRYWASPHQTLFSPKDDYGVEILPAEKIASNSAKIVIDVAGSVKQPGIYQLAFGSRIEEALQIAGGLSDQADLSWVEKTLNRAQKLTDGQKIYIPSLDEPKGESADRQSGTIAGVTSSSTVSINTANQAELEALWGIGQVTARAIIDGRPYGDVGELVSRKIVKQSVYDKIKDKLSL